MSLISMECLARESMQNYHVDFSFQKGTAQAMQVVAEASLHDLFKDAVAVARHAGQRTVRSSDLRFVRRIRGQLCWQ